MKKKLSLFLALAAVAAMIAVPTNAETEAPTKVLNCGDYAPIIDGEIDDAYYKSYSIKHEWPAERTGTNPNNYWGCGIWAFDDSNTTAYDWDKQIEATSYFLWEELDGAYFIYVAVEVKDHTGVFELPAEKYEQALAKGVQDYGPWLMDSVAPIFGVFGTDFSAQTRVDAGGNYGRMDGTAGLIQWDGWCLGHENNYDNGLWEVQITTDDAGEDTGYIVEFMWPMTELSATAMRNFAEGAKCLYGIQVVDTPENPVYADDEGEKANGNIVEGFNCFDFMTFEDKANNNVLTFTKETVVLDPETEAPVTTDPVTDAPVTTEPVTDAPVTTGPSTDGSVTGDVTTGGEDVPGPALIGDINNDGHVDAKDLTRLMKKISGQNVEAFNSDLTGDGNVDTKDLTRLMKTIAGVA